VLDRAQASGSTWLDLDGCALTEIPDQIFALTNLETLDLSDNGLKNIPDRLWKLPNLKSVNLIGNPIVSLPNRPGLTIDLQTYRLCYTQIDATNINLFVGAHISHEDADFWAVRPKVARGLRKLTVGTLNLRIELEHPKPSSAIWKILKTLSNCVALEELSLCGLYLENVPEGIRRLPCVKWLELDGLGLDRLPDWIGDLDIETFSAINNNLAELPDSFQRLQHLESLDLGWNPLDQIPSLVFSLPSLDSLYLRSCNIREISADVLQAPQLKYLDIHFNPIESPPAEITNNGLEAIRDYWRQRADTGVDYLCEAKLIILGEAEAGKTSLAKKIENPNYELRDREKSTEGIDVIRYQFPTAIRVNESGEERVLNRMFQVNIWDFGGQEIYHATHQFFLTRRSVYVLVCDDRKQDTDFSFWLQIIEMLSDASPLWIVQNEKQDRKRDINLSNLRMRFDNLRGALSTNLDTIAVWTM